MAHEQALLLVNNVMQQLQSVGMNIVQAAADGKVDPIELLMLTSQAGSIAVTLAATIVRADKNLQQDMLFVLQHGTFVVTE